MDSIAVAALFRSSQKMHADRRDGDSLTLLSRRAVAINIIAALAFISSALHFSTRTRYSPPPDLHLPVSRFTRLYFR